MRRAIATIAIVIGGGVVGASLTHGAVRPSWRERIAPYREAVLDTATTNHAKPAAKRLAGDTLADAYLKAAADRLRARTADLEKPADVQAEVQAFCVGMGVLMDRTGALATNPMVRLALGEVESVKERSARNKLLGDPTVRGRSDWCRHLWVSCALRGLLGRAMAERAGVSKELADAKKKSGFSLADLCSNVAGLEFAERLLAPHAKTNPIVARIGPIAERGRHTDWMPEVKDLPEGLDAATAAARFGGAGDAKMVKTLADLRALVRTAPGYAAKRK